MEKNRSGGVTQLKNNAGGIVIGAVRTVYITHRIIGTAITISTLIVKDRAKVATFVYFSLTWVITGISIVDKKVIVPTLRAKLFTRTINDSRCTKT